MNLKQIACAGAIATAAVAASAIAPSSAQAATIYFNFTDPLPTDFASTFSFSGAGGLSVVASPNSGDVARTQAGLGIRSAGDAVPALNQIEPQQGIKEILTLTFNRSVRLVSANFGAVDLNDEFSTFLLSSSQTVSGAIPGGNSAGTGSGVFDFSAALAAADRQGSVFQFTSLNRDDGYFLRGVTVEAIPTPALLPGLVGLGIAALRKRKADAKAEA